MNNLILNEKLAAQKLGIAVQTLRNWRHQGRGPSYIKMGRRIGYQEKDLERYVQANRIEPQAA